jgi:Adenylate and Guanylate cyclase catalytic domain
MERKSAQRRLAAILAADVVGYSRLMSVDEMGTLTSLKAHRRELIDPAIAGHHGRIVKTTGDGALVEFGSVVDAVQCAVAIQRGMLSRNSDIGEDKRIVFRIGVNVGDIIIDDGDLYGDGVNIAARLEALWEPAYASRARRMTRSETSSRSPLPTWANRSSRTSRARSASMGSPRWTLRRCRNLRRCNSRRVRRLAAATGLRTVTNRRFFSA